METLWAPWRLPYLREGAGIPPGVCIFCAFPSARNDEGHLILHQDERVFVILNRYPYNNGHLMVVPRQHGGSLEDLPLADGAALMARVQQTVGILKRVYRCPGVNLGMNLGEAAGAGIAEHLHFHVLPRWNGDTNFMPLLADVKVVAEHLHETWTFLRPHFADLPLSS